MKSFPIRCCPAVPVKFFIPSWIKAWVLQNSKKYGIYNIFFVPRQYLPQPHGGICDEGLSGKGRAFPGDAACPCPLTRRPLSPNRRSRRSAGRICAPNHTENGCPERSGRLFQGQRALTTASMTGTAYNASGMWCRPQGLVAGKNALRGGKYQWIAKNWNS